MASRILVFAFAALTLGANAQQLVSTEGPVSPDAGSVKDAGKTTEKHKAGKYPGPTTLVSIPETPMLDEAGMQRLDPDGVPMFNPATVQARAKDGHPAFDEKGVAIMRTDKEPGYDEHGKKLKAVAAKAPVRFALTIADGTLLVDGFVAKAALNYNISELQFLYVVVPGLGTTVISSAPFPGAKEQPQAFHDKALTVKLGSHAVTLASTVPLAGRGKKAQSAYVLVDRHFATDSHAPKMAFGEAKSAPYAWGGTKSSAPVVASDQRLEPIASTKTVLVSSAQ